MPLITVIPRGDILASVERHSTLHLLGGVMVKRSTRMVYRSFCATKSRTSTASCRIGQSWLTQRSSSQDPCGLALLIVHGPTDEPHSRLATDLLAPSRSCRVVLAGGRRRARQKQRGSEWSSSSEGPGTGTTKRKYAMVQIHLAQHTLTSTRFKLATNTRNNLHNTSLSATGWHHRLQISQTKQQSHSRHHSNWRGTMLIHTCSPPIWHSRS